MLARYRSVLLERRSRTPRFPQCVGSALHTRKTVPLDEGDSRAQHGAKRLQARRGVRSSLARLTNAGGIPAEPKPDRDAAKSQRSDPKAATSLDYGIEETTVEMLSGDVPVYRDDHLVVVGTLCP